jgi:hypothetical protein
MTGPTTEGGSDTPLHGPESRSPGQKPARAIVSPTGLIVVLERLTVAQRKERREDNKTMRKLHAKVRRRKKHGRR